MATNREADRSSLRRYSFPTNRVQRSLSSALECREEAVFQEFVLSERRESTCQRRVPLNYTMR
jgi:hypothetical protein